jgi:hypothetical protein
MPAAVRDVVCRVAPWLVAVLPLALGFMANPDGGSAVGKATREGNTARPPAVSMRDRDRHRATDREREVSFDVWRCGAGLAGAQAMAIDITLLMWLRTVMNHQVG